MTTSRRRPTTSEPCILPDASASPPEHFLFWDQPCNTIYLSSATPSSDLSMEEVLGVLSRSASTWENVQCAGSPVGLQFEVLGVTSTCTAPLYRNSGGNANTVMFVSDWSARGYDSAAFAVTTVWRERDTGRIVDVDMEVNERRGPYGVCAPGGCVGDRLVDLENVVTHELGHFLGLAHSEVDEATMFSTSTADETIKRTLDGDDEAGLCAAYPPGAFADAECNFESVGGTRVDCDPGCSISPARRSSGLLGLLVAFAAVVSIRRRRDA